jgi:hypothetical protein
VNAAARLRPKIKKKGPRAGKRWALNSIAEAQAVKLVPHPQPPVALGLVKVKPEPCIEVT